MGRNLVSKLNAFLIFAKKFLPSKIDLVIAFVIVFLALRVTILTPGYIGYADIGFPLDPHLYDGSISYVPSFFVNGTVVSLFSMTRGFISWPYLLLDYISNNMQFIERSYLFYGLFLFIVICYIFAKFLLNFFQERSGKVLSTAHYNIVKHSIALFAFSNLLAINYIVDGGFFSDDLIMVFISIEVVATISSISDFHYIAIVGVLLSITAFLDPDYYIISLISIFVVFLVVLARTPSVKSTMRFVYAVLVSLPVVIFMQLVLAIPYSVPGAITEPFSRSLSSVYFNGTNHVWWLSIVLLGHAWSIITFGPPTVMFLGNKISYTAGILFPTQILLPPGPITFIWLVALYSIPIVSFFSLAFKITRKYALPIVILSIIGVLLSIYGSFTPIYRFIYLLTKIPYIGQSIGTTFSEPGHFLIIVASAYLVLFPMTVFNLLVRENRNDKPKSSFYSSIIHLFGFQLRIERLNPHKRKLRLRVGNNTRRRKRLTYVVLLIILLMLFANWQVFSGSFYPARADNSYRLGNGIPDVGAFSPYGIPASYQDAYYYIESQVGNSNVYWPIGLSAPPANEISLPGFPYLAEHNLSDAVAPYLEASGVKYVVVYNLENLTQPLYWPVASVPAEFEMWFGIPTYTGVLDFLNSSPGLKIAVHLDDIYLYRVDGVNSLYYNSSLLMFNSSNNVPPYLYAVFKQIGLNASFSPWKNIGYSYGVNTTTMKVNILSPSFMLGHLKQDNRSSPNNTKLEHQPSNIGHKQANYMPSLIPYQNRKNLSFAPFSQYLNISTGQYVLELGNMSGFAYIDIEGSGSLDNFSVLNLKNYTIVSIPFDRTISINGNFSVSYMVITDGSSLTEMRGSYVVYNAYTTRAMILTTSDAIYHPYTTSDGYGLYVNVTGDIKSVSAPALVTVQYIYYALLGYLLLLSIWLCSRRENEKRKPSVL